MLYERYKYYKICKGEKGIVFWRCELHKAGCGGRATYVGEPVEVTCPEHNHPPDQALDLLRRTNGSQHCLSDNTASAIS